MDTDFDIFQSFFGRREPSIHAFKADISEESSSLFAVSQNSINELTKWTRGARNEIGESFELILGFLDIMSPNAVADKDAQKFFIAMNVPLFTSIAEFTMFCFTQKNFFTDIGDAERENSPKPIDDRVPGIWLMDHTKKGHRVSQAHSEQLIPKCSIRYEASIYLSQLMSRFVWLHELAHCFNGHLNYVRHEKIALRLHELEENLTIAQTNKNRTIKKSEILRILEYEADRSALWGSIRIQSDNLENIEGITKLDKTVRLKLTLFGAYAMTWLFEEYQAYLNVTNNYSHPTPDSRLHNLLRIARKNLPQHIEGFDQINNNACQTFDAIREAIPSIYSSRDLFRNMDDSSIEDQLDRIDIETKNVRKALKHFEFFKSR